MRAATRTLASFEIAVRGAGATLARGKPVRVHAEAHGATRLTPLETGLEQHTVKTFLLSLPLDQARSRHDERPDA